MRRSNPGTAAIWLFAGVLSLWQFTALANTQTPEDVVREATSKLQAAVDEGKTYYDQDPERFYRAVESVLSPFVDFDAISRSVMAVYYRKATAEQRKRFADTFKWGLVRTYSGALIDSGNEGIVVLDPDKPPRNPKRQSVKMEITTADGKVYPVIYSMVQSKDGSWKMRNIIINGVNIGLTYRNQFASAMRDPENGGDLNKVIDGWADVIAEVKPVGDTAGEKEARIVLEESDTENA